MALAPAWHTTRTRFSEEYLRQRLNFHQTNQRGGTLIILVYVDDIAIFGTLNDIQAFKEQIASRYKITDLGEIHQFLGLHIARDRSRKTLTIDQSHYIQHMLTHFEMVTCKLVNTPFAAGTSLQQIQMKTWIVLLSHGSNKLPAHSCMQYSDPDICFAVN
jgi:hypothetical protein